MDLNRKISAGAVLFVLMLILGGLAAMRTTQRLGRTAAAVSHAGPVLDGLNTTLRLVTDVESGARGYALTGREEFLDPYRRARDRLPEALSRLRALTADRPDEQAQIAALASLITDRVAISDTLVATRRTRGLQAAAAQVTRGRGREAMTRVRERIEDLQRQEHLRLRERTEADHTAAVRTYRVLGIVFSVALLLVLAAALALRRGITRRTRRLLDGLERMAAGDLQVHVEPGPRDELGRLALAFNETVRQRHQVEEELGRADALLRGVFNASPLAIVAVDVMGKVQVWNQAAERIFGWRADEVMGRPLPFIPEDQADELARIRERVMTRREVLSGLEHKGRRRDGTLFDISLSIAPLVYDGPLAGMMAVLEDITARKQALDALRESEERFRLALDEAPIGMALVGLDGRFLRVNNALCEIVGYSREDLTGLNVQAITHPADLDADAVQSEKLARGEIPRYQLHKRYLRRDGGVVDVLLSRSLVRAPDGAPLYFIAQSEDVTDRRRAEEALRRSEAQFRGLIEETPDGVFVNSGGHVVYANRALATLLGYDDSSALRGRAIADLFHPDDLPAIAERIRRLQDGGVHPPHELRMARRDGSICSIETAAIQVQFEERPGILVIVRDLTERKRAERARDEAHQWLRAVIDLAPVGIMLTRDGRSWEGNRRAERLFGRPIVPSLDLAAYRRALLDTDGKPLAMEKMPGVRALRGEHVEMVEMQLVRPDGRAVPIMLNAAPIPGSETMPAGAMVAFDDITPMKELERLRSEWSSLIAHDLRQPLTGITLYTQILAEQTAGDPALNRKVLQIRALARRLDRMVQDLLDFSRLEARQLTLDRRAVDLLHLVREAIDRNALDAPDRRIELSVEGAPAPVEGDADRLAQVMDNLLTNAVKYGAPDTPIRVDVVAEPDAGVSVSVTNQGPGIDPEDQSALFTRFQRLPDAGRRGVKGIGLGLYITRELIEAHGGRIVVESTPGEKTTFRFTLPPAARAARQAEPPPPPGS